ncbi:hypothetical protein AB6A40_011321 [Gnathostoma spinigerum]|uniref:Uncharacterized protein n=1 Tax=Gnathostoma spinigerum TaxID=75299 RepID=A0ABD6EZM3_9BILA
MTSLCFCTSLTAIGIRYLKVYELVEHAGCELFITMCTFLIFIVLVLALSIVAIGANGANERLCRKRSRLEVCLDVNCLIVILPVATMASNHRWTVQAAQVATS